MTLPEFFLRLMELVQASPIAGDMKGGFVNDRKELVRMNLEHLMTISSGDPHYWPYNRSVIVSLWDSVKPDLDQHGLFREFEGQEELRKNLRFFLFGEREEI